MSLLYFVLATLLYIIALPVLVYLRFQPKHKDSIPARFFLKNNPPFLEKGIWFHACSLGEVRSLKPFVEALKQEPLNMSVITQTGFQEALRYGAAVRYLPFEIFLPFWMRKQKVLVVLEAELWPMLFCIAKAKGVKTILVNARISDRSYRSYLRFAFLYRWIFGFVDVVFAQSEIDKARLESLGAKDVRVGGNIKTFQHYQVTKSYPKRENKRIVLLASTHEKEEELLLSQIERLPDDQLIVVPRHPERFEAVDLFLRAYAQSKNETYERLSQQQMLSSDIVLCDTIGELINLYAIADVVILGGSFVEGIGGHNPLEPAFFNVRLISGPYTFNQNALFPLVKNVLTCNAWELKEVLKNTEAMLPSALIHGGDITPLLNEIRG